MDRELHLPKSWTSDRERCQAAQVPDSRGFATKTELAQTLVTRALASPLPTSWVTADALYGQDWHFRRMLQGAGIGYVVAVPKSQQVKSLASCWRIAQLIGDVPGSGSRAGMPKAPASTTGQPHSFPPSRSSTATSPAIGGGSWPAAASPGRTRSPTWVAMAGVM
ncbi:transposase [Streptomyces sp. S.PNR 29]|nr:transposase [Streptomyces sp. S.PNR 29]MDN0198682.1 transposase [Streptomyces sp. S.PNR 29]